MHFKYLLSKIWRIVGMRLYCNAEVLLMELKENHIISSPAEIRLVSLTNINDASTFQTKRQISDFKKFLESGHEGYYAYLDKICIHRSWVVKGTSQVYLHKFLRFNILENDIFIQNCETAVNARGKNIFTHVLSHIGRLHSQCRVLTSVDKLNFASQNSMRKAGFTVIAKFKVRVMMGFKSNTIEYIKE